MYWRVAELIDEHNNKWLVYNYFAFITKSNVPKPWYNGITKVWKYPIEKELIIRAAMAESEESFHKWYQDHHKKLT